MRTILTIVILGGLTAMPCAAQFPDGYTVSEPPPLPDLLWESYNDSRVELRIQRHAASPRLRRLLRIAEGLIPDPSIIDAAQDSVLAEMGMLGNHARNFQRAAEVEGPRWAWTDFEELLPFALHGLAVQHFADRVREYAEQAYGTESTMRVEYEARALQLEDGGFEVRMSLRYDKFCGSLCAFAFQHRRTVRFNQDETVVEVSGDRPTFYRIS